MGDSIYGAPKIYGAVFPIADGPVEAWIPPVGLSEPFSGSLSPWFSQIAAQPQNVGSFISRDDSLSLNAWPSVNQSFQFDASAVPGASAIAAVHVACLWSFEAASKQMDGNIEIYVGYTGTPVNSFISGGAVNFNPLFSGSLFSVPLVNPATLPFHYYCAPFTVNPVTGLPWVLAEFSGGTPLLLGPAWGHAL